MLGGLIKMECPILFLDPHFDFALPPLNKMKKPKVITVISLVFLYFPFFLLRSTCLAFDSKSFCCCLACSLTFNRAGLNVHYLYVGLVLIYQYRSALSWRALCL